VCVCVAKFRDPTAFMKLNLDPVTRHALLCLYKRPFATVDICSKLCNTNTKRETPATEQNSVYGREKPRRDVTRHNRMCANWDTTSHTGTLK